MPVHAPEPEAPAAWNQRVGAYRELPGLIRELGGDSGALLERVGLPPDALADPEARVPFEAICQLLQEAAVDTGCAHLGLLAGRVWRLADLGAVGELTRHSPTVRDALQTLVVHQCVNSDGALGFLIERDGFLDLGYGVFRPGVAHVDQIHDAVMAAAMNFMRELCGPAWRPSQVLLAHARPRDASPFRRAFRVTPAFNAEFSALRFAPEWMDVPVKGADPARREDAARRIARGDASLVRDVVRALRLLLLQGRSSGDDVAALLSMHRRTLNRRLQTKGTTFQQLLDQVRLDLARQLLATSDISLDDLAATLGYTAVSSFMRTFRRWTGTTPGQWRCAAADPRGSRSPAGRIVAATALGQP